MTTLTVEQRSALATLDAHALALSSDPDFITMVRSIESGLAVTKGNYDKYGTLVHTLSKGSSTMKYVVAKALVLAGANKQGVADGVRLLT